MKGRKLGELLKGVSHRGVGLALDKAIDKVVFNSRDVAPGSLFVALSGQKYDGHNFFEEVIRRGCRALVVEQGKLPESKLVREAEKHKVSSVIVDDSRKVLGLVASAFYGHPARELSMIGITGTNGKTTTTYLLESMLNKAGFNPGVIGTVNYRYGGVQEDASHTTPEPVKLQGLLRRMADRGITHVIMEVSSHALSQERISGLFFDVGLFMNLSRDHLDFHSSMEEYFHSKSLLFSDHLKEEGTAVILSGQDQDEGQGWGGLLVADLIRLNEQTDRPFRVIECGIGAEEVSLQKVKLSGTGISVQIKVPGGQWNIESPLVGMFNAYNLLGAVGVGTALGIESEKGSQGLAALDSVPGRLQSVGGHRGPKIFVDYAHTPDALKNVLQTLNELPHNRLIVVFGCGGDRDAGKRPIMGQIAATYADIVIMTSDNPRSENPQEILSQIERGIPASMRRSRVEWLSREKNRRGYDVIESRRDAISAAIRSGGCDDLVLIAGKGHEDYQITRSGRSFFDDRVEAQKQYRVIQW